MENVAIDFIGQNGAQGEMASYMAANGRLDANAMRPFLDVKTGKAYISVYTGGDSKNPENYKAQQVPIQNNGTLRRDEWKRVDEAVLMISENRLTGIQDLIANGLTYDIGNGMNSTVLEYEDVSDALEAVVTMDGVTRGNNDRQVFSTKYLPLPIIHADYQINTRVLMNSRNRGNPMDTGLAERASRKVNEKLEAMLFTDIDYTFGGGTIYSYINAPDRNLVTLTENWDSSGKTGAEIVTEVLSLKQASMDAYHYGPWQLYIPSAYETKLDEDYSAAKGSNTIRERIMKIEGIKGIKVVDTLTANNVLLVQMTSDVVRLVRGMGIQNVEWQTEGKMITKYKVMTIQVPQVRADQDGNSGIVHLS